MDNTIKNIRMNLLKCVLSSKGGIRIGRTSRYPLPNNVRLFGITKTDKLILFNDLNVIIALVTTSFNVGLYVFFFKMCTVYRILNGFAIS